jgi:glycosyltransferase involved in cell wall biosynthesis
MSPMKKRSAAAPAPVYRVALVMIARNEAARIVRALSSARPCVDELVVLDTGSTDATVALARSAGARVGHFAWIDDFAAARNAALALADADWNVILDADEWIAERGVELLALRHTAPEFVGALRVDSQFDTPTGIGVSPSWLQRVLPRGVRYEGRVHEQPRHALAVRPLETAFTHDGYRAGALQAKAGRNAELLARALALAPDDAYLHYQLGKDHDVYERYAEAAVHFARSRDCEAAHGAGGVTLAGAVPGWHHDRLVREIHALKRCRRHAEAVQLADRSMAAWATSPDFFFALGDLLLDWATEEPTRAGELLPMIEQAWLRCLEIGERPELEGSVAGRGSALAARNLAVLYEGTGRAIEALRFRQMG